MTRITILVLISFSSVTFASIFAGAPGSQELQMAHRKYLENDALGTIAAIRDQLEKHPDDDYGNRNALDLLEQTFAEAGEGGIALDWRLPKEISLLLIDERRMEWKKGATYQLQAAGNSLYGAIKQLKIVKVPGRTLIDRNGGVGRWNEFEPGRRDAEYGFKYFSPEYTEPIGPGLFRIEIELKNGKSTHGWFVMSGPSPSRGPKIVEPRQGAQIFVRSPTFRWEDFGALDYFPFERRHCIVKVIPEENQLTRWSFTFGDRSTSKRLSVPPVSAKVGLNGALIGGDELDIGSYLSYLSCDAIRREGDLLLSREVMTFAPFTVVEP